MMIKLQELTVLAASLGLITLLHLSSASKCSLEGKSFLIRSKVITFYNNYIPTRESLLEESYSAEQKRAKIIYSILERAGSRRETGRYGSGLFYFDSTRLISAVVDEPKFRASSASVDELRKVIGLSNIDGYDDEDKPYADDFIVGPARLLFFLNKYRDKQQLVELTNVIKIANVHCLKYNFFHKTKSGQNIRFNIYYSEISLAADAQSIPMQVVIEYLDAGLDLSQIVINYSPLQSLYSPYSVLPHSNAHHRVQFEQFCLDTLSGFSELLTKSNGENLFAAIPTNTAKFSFKAVVEKANRVRGTRFVAYDAKLDTLIQRPKWSNTRKSGITQMLFNLRLNRLYHIATSMPNSNTLIDKVLQLGRNDSPEDTAGALGDNTQCIVAKVLPSVQMGSTTKPLSIGLMLVGSDRFVYLGHARVRGVLARVYEASDGYIPFWLDHRLVYKMAKNGAADAETQRSLYHDMTEAGGSISTTALLYISDDEEATIPEPNILMMEIYASGTRGEELQDKITVHFYNFKWELDHDENPESLFSLQDLCSSGIGRNQYALVKLQLETERPTESEAEQSSLFESRTDTNLALMGSLQSNLKLAGPMIYDLNWHLASNINNDREYLRLVTSFRVAEHPDNVIELIYLGQGSMNYRKRKEDKSPYTLHEVMTLAGCYFLAAHRRANVFLAYDPKPRTCYIDFKPIEDNLQEFPPYFTESPQGRMEVYRINHVADIDKSNTWMRDIYKTASQLYTNQALLIGTKMTLLDVKPDHSSVEFTVRQAEVDERNFRTSSAIMEEKNKQEILTDRLEGFGLVATGDNSRRVGPTPINVNHWNLINSKEAERESTISREQCHASCLSDTTCRSYSICIEESEIKCVISKASFRSSQTIDELMELAKGKGGKSSLNRNIHVKTDDGQVVELVKHRNCELNNLVFLDHFFKPKMVRNTYTNRYIYPVRNLDECAEMCLRQSIGILQQDIERQLVTAQSVFDADSSSDDHEKLRTLLNDHRQVTKQICRTFFYIDKARLLSFPRDTADKIRDGVISRNSGSSPGRHLIGMTYKDNGYCVMVDPMRKEDVQLVNQSEDKPNEYIDIEMYSFRFDLFYEKQYGVRLLGTKMDGLQLEAQKMATLDSREITMEHFQVLKAFVQNGDNSQDMIQATASKCATVCFLQTWGPWPACRSFDVILERQSTFPKCYLNSITLQQAIKTQRLDLIDDSSDVQAWHYEPHSGFVVDESNLDGNLRMSEILQGPSKSSSNFRFNLGLSLLVVVAAVASGLFAGLLATRTYIKRKGLPTRMEHDMLVTDS